jgi:MFS family permease
MPMLRDTLLMMAIIGTFTYEFTVILPLFAEFTFGKGASGYALLTASMGAGAVVGGIVTASRKRQSTPTMLLLAAFLFGVTDLIAASAPSLPFAMAAFVLVGFFSITFTALGNVTVQLASAPEMRGRVMAIWTMAFLGSTPIGGPIIGWIGEHAGPRWGLAVGGIAAILASGYGAWALRRAGRKRATAEETRPQTS